MQNINLIIIHRGASAIKHRRLSFSDALNISVSIATVFLWIPERPRARLYDHEELFLWRPEGYVLLHVPPCVRRFD
jgi:hypothetical protein